MKEHEFRSVQEPKGYMNGHEKDARRREITRGERRFEFRAARAERLALKARRERAREIE